MSASFQLLLSRFTATSDKDKKFASLYQNFAKSDGLIILYPPTDFGEF
jgi:hypothetical protein